MIRGIIFDCFGVLYGTSDIELQRLCPIELRQDLRDYNRQADYGFITSEEYISAVAQLLNKSKEEVADILRTKHVRNQELMSYVQSLKGKCKTALLSNVSNDVIERLFSKEDFAMFDEVVLSYREHIVKPNPAIYMLVARRLGLTEGECVMIDDLAENCEGAEVAGMTSIQHTSNETTIDVLSKMLRS